jgi:hypothetical protein
MHTKFAALSALLTAFVAAPSGEAAVAFVDACYDLHPTDYVAWKRVDGRVAAMAQASAASRAALAA